MYDFFMISLCIIAILSSWLLYSDSKVISNIRNNITSKIYKNFFK